jgi:hypothetical protein
VKLAIYLRWVLIFFAIVSQTYSFAQEQEDDFYKCFNFGGLKGRVKEIAYFWYTPNPKDTTALLYSKTHVNYIVSYSINGQRIKETMLSENDLISSIIIYDYQVGSVGYKVSRSSLTDYTWKQFLYYNKKYKLLKSEYYHNDSLTSEGTYQYNSIGKRVKFEQKTRYSIDGWLYSYVTNKRSERKYVVNNLDTTLFYSHELLYDINNNQIERNEYNERHELEAQYLKEYDTKGFVIKEVYRKFLNTKSKSEQYIGFYENLYDEAGNLIKQTSFTNQKEPYLVQVRKIVYY